MPKSENGILQVVLLIKLLCTNGSHKSLESVYSHTSNEMHLWKRQSSFVSDLEMKRTERRGNNHENGCGMGHFMFLAKKFQRFLKIPCKENLYNYIEAEVSKNILGD